MQRIALRESSESTPVDEINWHKLSNDGVVVSCF
jgi:hypothetical protein